MLNSDIRDQAYLFFVEEAPELLEAIENSLLALREDRSTARVHEMMRAAHSIKGGAASVQLDPIKEIAHRLETIFKALYDETVEIDTALESQLLQAYDCLRLPLTEQIEAGRFDVEQALEAAEAVFVPLEQRLEAALQQADSYIPTSSDLGIDMVASIFEIDVAQGLERLAMVLQQPQEYPIAGELQAQAEVFIGLSELLDLPGFGEIAQTSLAALDYYPDRALEILQLALADFEAGRNAVLAGDRVQGGSPSAALMAFAQQDVNEHSSIQSSLCEWEFEDSLNRSADWIETGEAESTPDLEMIWDPALLEEAPLAAMHELTPDSVWHVESIDWLADSEISPATAESEGIDPALEELPLEFKPNLNDDVIFNEINNLSDHFIENSINHLTKDEIPDPIADWLPAVAPDLMPVSLDEMVQSAIDQFDQLPAFVPETPVTSPAPADSASQPAEQEPWKQYLRPAEATPQTKPTNLSVRVDLERLERMNNLVGELAISRNSLSLQNEQLQGSVSGLVERFAHFQSLIQRLQDLSDRMLVAPISRVQSDRIGSVDRPALLQSGTMATTLIDSFDALEMDRYSGLHFQLQEIFEQTVQLEEALGDVGLFAGQSNQTLGQQRQQLTQLQNELMWARMLPLGNVLNRFPRVLRDLSAKYGKIVNLNLNGTGVLVDKVVLEKLYDPLLHLLRNAFDHGIETPNIRKLQGKSSQGTIEIRAYHRGNQTWIDIIDDGKGLDTEQIGQRAVELGWLSVAELERLKPEQLQDFIFAAGFSTAAQVSELSGRGVGLDVVRSQLRALKGNVSVSSLPGQGTTFRLSIPLTLTMAKLLTCGVGTSVIAIPSDSIEEIMVPQAHQLRQSGGQQFLYWQEHLIPIYRMVDLLDYSCTIPDYPVGHTQTAVPTPQDWHCPLLVIQREQHSFAIEIERLITEQELVIKPFGSAIMPPAYTYGCTILGDGSLVPVIDVATLVDGQLQPGAIGSLANSLTPTVPPSPTLPQKQSMQQSIKTILVVDDSSTLRRMLALTLEKRGYRVLQARDGQEALAHLRQAGTVQLVICDIEMPNMNGFEFLSQRRQQTDMVAIPVVMLTSRNNEKHRRLAMQLGATDYFSKPYIEQNLLQAVTVLLNDEPAVLIG